MIYYIYEIEGGNKKMNFVIIKMAMVLMTTLSSLYAPTTLYNPVDQTLVGTTIDQSIVGDPQAIIDNLTAVPEGTKVLDYYIVNDIGFLNLSHEFTDTKIDGAENTMMTVYSIVGTFCSAKEVNHLLIMVEGEMQPILFDGLKADRLFNGVDIFGRDLK